ncbi:unnamed protein product [Heligmosomoides polygyrus]|uniref:CX domain-containing protein n=1 Tax=Heligmosomoides polygyrus TaxID=6339 RepID=A0A183GPB6_HELPZ|nr:unnamed protein product [Heligmosomoides polygyrus]
MLLLLVSAGAADHVSCAAHFPIRDSVMILKKLVAKHATPVVRKDANGTEWLNNLFEKNGPLEVDGVHYFLNDNRLPPEMTFYFTDSLLLDSVPIFVVDPNQTKTWRPDFPDRTYALTKISHRCDVGQRACGLKCCYEENHTIQKVDAADILLKVGKSCKVMNEFPNIHVALIMLLAACNVVATKW